MLISLRTSIHKESIMSILHTEALTKLYGTPDQAIYALNGVNLSVEAGEFVAIMGPSGSGKSTALYLMGGLERPTSGKVWLRDADMTTLNDDALSTLRRTSLGFVFQFFNLIPVLSARENVAIPLILDGVPRPDALRRADEALARVGLANRGEHRPSEMSGGQRMNQRATWTRVPAMKWYSFCVRLSINGHKRLCW
jgi:putative ABC transport system ATP-binding protein